ncbi:uncharacterized protein C8A04DRAFT_16054 [Dichotomopilus funicola]|uniref:Haloacid dehalogenase n=1 Tax=Dichotomopilus funicola TaxID=1934379 RepID=A0AAN6UV96_9PEZI|nr:hypothetical protein C8A04DRAFT_16054 [Dichotomopilus funicola]
MERRNLLLCFDAFGTLFHPKSPIHEQYTAVARQCGLQGFNSQDVAASFRAAFSSEIKAYPNYGKSSGMGATTWWTNVIHKTFQPLVGTGVDLPKQLAPTLLHRFASHEGYTVSPGVLPLIRTLKEKHQGQRHHQPTRAYFHRVVVGVITNSDDRVPSILSSLGFNVSPLRFGTDIEQPHVVREQQYDVDLHCMSYDVGFAKPDRQIFDAAEGLATQLVATQEGVESVEQATAATWCKVYIGDEYEKDVVGARTAGWIPAFVGDGDELPEELLDLNCPGEEKLSWASNRDNTCRVVRAGSTQEILAWLVEETCNE